MQNKLLLNALVSTFIESKTTHEPQWTLTALTDYLREWESVRYQLGGLSKQGVDCSGFVYLVFLSQFGVKLPRNTTSQVQLGETVAQEELQTGDLVFFRAGSTGKHVGIYLKNRQFVHASRSQGVTLSSMDSHYWATKYWTAKRVVAKT